MSSRVFGSLRRGDKALQRASHIRVLLLPPPSQVFTASLGIRVAEILRVMAATLLRKSSTQPTSGAARVAWTAALQHPEVRLLGDHSAAPLQLLVNGAMQGSRRPVSAGSTLLGSLTRSVSSRPLCAGIHWSRGLLSRSFYADSVGVQQSERKESSGGEVLSEGFSNSGSVTVQSLQPSLSLEDFRSLIVRKKSEVAILEAALDMLETAPRDKRFEDLVRKHNLQFESKKSVPGDFVGKPYNAFKPPTTVDPLTDSFKSKNDNLENKSVGFNPTKTTDSQLDGSSNVAKPPSSPTMFGRLSLSDFPAPRDPNLERLQKKRRRLELLKEYERKNKIESLNFGASGRSSLGGSEPREELPPFDPLKPNAGAFLEKPEKTYRSLADRLYEEQFGHPAPPGLKRTYPKGSFYDRCMKEKERKEREAAAAAAAAARIAPKDEVSSPPSRPIESVSSQREEENIDNPTERNVSSNDVNQERKPGAWKCPECTFFNLSGDKFCYKCQAQRGENGERRSATA